MVSETQRAVLKEMAEGGGKIIQPRDGRPAWLYTDGPRFSDTVNRRTWAALLREGYIAPVPGSMEARHYRLTPAGRQVVS